MKLQYYCFLGLILGSCMPTNTAKPVPIPAVIVDDQQPDTTLPCFKWRCEADSASYTHIKGPFYRGKDGDVYEKSYADSWGNKCCYSRAVYRNRLKNNTYSETERPTLKKTLDLQTYVELEPSMYSKDRNHVYESIENIDGSWRFIIEQADPATFQCLDSTFLWGIDKQHVFYKGELVEGLSSYHLKTLKQVLANPESFDQIRVVRGKPNYVKNDKMVFFQKEQVLNADVPSFQVVDSGQFDAFDKYRKYMGGHPVNLKE
jgi:DKNYY family